MNPEFCDLWALKRFNSNLEHPTHLWATDDPVPVPPLLRILGNTQMRTWEAGCCLGKTAGETVGSSTELREILEANKTEQARGTAKNLLFRHLFQYRTV